MNQKRFFESSKSLLAESASIFLDNRIQLLERALSALCIGTYIYIYTARVREGGKNCEGYNGVLLRAH